MAGTYGVTGSNPGVGSGEGVVLSVKTRAASLSTSAGGFSATHDTSYTFCRCHTDTAGSSDYPSL